MSLSFTYGLAVPSLLHGSDLDALVSAAKNGPYVPDHKTGRNFSFDVLASLEPSLLAPLSSPTFLRRIEHLSGLSGLERFEGQVKRLEASGRFPWHHDKNAGQRLGISINLGQTPYGGGAFEVRWKWSSEVLLRLRSTCPGDGHLIDVADSRLVHRVAPVVGGVPRLFLAGWFW